jgi:hypothetical protein
MSPFLLANEKVGGIEVRPFSLTTQNAIDALSDCKFNRVEQAASLLWCQMREVDEVKAAITAGTLEQSIRDLAAQMPLAYLKPIEAWAERQNEMILSGQVEIISKDLNSDEPGNSMGQGGANRS